MKGHQLLEALTQERARGRPLVRDSGSFGWHPFASAGSAQPCAAGSTQQRPCIAQPRCLQHHLVTQPEIARFRHVVGRPAACFSLPTLVGASSSVAEPKPRKLGGSKSLNIGRAHPNIGRPQRDFGRSRPQRGQTWPKRYRMQHRRECSGPEKVSAAEPPTRACL